MGAWIVHRMCCRRLPRALGAAVALAFVTPSAGLATTWTGAAGDGSWQSALNWEPGLVPSGVGQAASLLGDFGASLRVTTRAPVTLGALTLGNTGGALVLGGATPADGFTFEAAAAAATLDVAAGSGATRIEGALRWAGELRLVQNSGAAPLTLAGSVGGGGALTVAGAGRVVISGDTSALTGAVQLQSGRLDLVNGLAAAGSSVSLADGSTLATGGPVQRAVAGTAGATLLMLAPEFNGVDLRYGLSFGDASRADGFSFRGAIRVDNAVGGGVSAAFGSATSIVIDRPQEIAGSIYTFTNGITLTGAGQFRGEGVIVGRLTDLTSGGTPFAPNGFGIPFALQGPRIDAGSADIHVLGHDLRLSALTMAGGTLHYHLGPGQGPTRFLELNGPLRGHGVLEADYLVAGSAATVTATGPLTLRGGVGRLSVPLSFVVEAGGVFRAEGASDLSGTTFRLDGGRVELARVAADSVAAAQFSGHGTLVLDDAGKLPLASVPLVGAATGTVTIDQALDVGRALGVIHSSGPVQLGHGGSITLAGGLLASASGYVLSGNARITGYGLVLGDLSDQTGGAGGLLPTGTPALLPPIDLPAGRLTVLSIGSTTLPFSAARRTGPTRLDAPNGVTLQQAAETISAPQPLAVTGAVRIAGDFNAGPLSATGDIVLAGGTVRGPLQTPGTLGGWGVVDGAVTAAAVVAGGTLAPQAGLRFVSRTQGLILSDRIVTLAPGSSVTLDDTAVSVPHGIQLQGQVLLGTGSIENVSGTPAQVVTPNRPGEVLRVGFAPGAAAVTNLRLGSSAVVFGSGQPVVLTGLNGDGSNNLARRTLESAQGIVVDTLFNNTPPAARPDLRVRGPLTLNAGSSPRLLETDTVQFNGARVADLVAHGAVTVNGNVTVDKRVVLQQGGTVNAGRTLTTPAVFGSLVVDGTWTAATALAITGRLRGSGTVAGNLTVHGSGRYDNAQLDLPLSLALGDGGIAPGTAAAAGLLHLTGTLVLRDAPTLAFRVGGPGASDQLRFASNAVTDLSGSTLQLQAAGLPGGSVALLVNTGTGGFGGSTFQGVAEGATLQFGGWLGSISYSGSFDPASGLALADGLGNDVVLWQIRPVPEPGSALLLVGGLAAIACRRGLRRRR